MRSLTDQGRLPDEHFSKKGSTTEDAKFDKTLMEDLSRQSRTPMSVVSVDAAQCYDRINHVIISLVWLTLIGVVGPIKVLLHCLQTMNSSEDRAWQFKHVHRRRRMLFHGFGAREQRSPTIMDLEFCDSKHTQETQTWGTHIGPYDGLANPHSRSHVH